MRRLCIVLLLLQMLGVKAVADQLVCHAEYLPPGSIDECMNIKPQDLQKATAYPLRPAAIKEHATLNEGGNVKIFWNENALLLVVDMEDSDIVQENNLDNQPHYLSGDVLEIFIRPAGQRNYWELFATPNNRTTAYFYPSAGRKLPSCLLSDGMPGYHIKTALNGTLNQSSDRDKNWRVIASISIKELGKCCPLDFTQPWLIQVARYNYSIYLDETELSHIGIADNKEPNFHRFSSYVKLYFDKNRN